MPLIIGLDQSYNCECKGYAINLDNEYEFMIAAIIVESTYPHSTYLIPQINDNAIMDNPIVRFTIAILNIISERPSDFMNVLFVFSIIMNTPAIQSMRK